MNLSKLLLILAFGTFSNVLVAQSGTLDPTFDGDGIVTTNVSTTPSTDAGNAAVVQPDGKIVVVGSSNNRFTVVRYNTDGSLDLTFNTYGVVFLSDPIAYTVMLQTDGKIVVAGTSSSALYLIRFNTDGSLDTAFDTDGKITVPNFNGPIFVKAIALASDGKILVSGYTGPTSNRDFAVFRFNTNGVLDTSFDTDGIVTTDFSANIDESAAMIIQSDGRIIVGGRSKISGPYDSALVRYNTDGSLDTTFGGTGKITTNFGGTDTIKAIDLQSDGKIVVSVPGATNIVIGRYNTDGTLDTTFDTDGKATLIGGDNTGIKVLTDGKILVSGTVNTDYNVARLNSNGSLDTTFGTAGYASYNIGADASNFMCVKSDGTIITGGTSDNRITLVQFSANGILNTFFQSTPISFGNSSIYSMVIQDDGKIVVLEDGNIARYNADGSLDNSFGTNGMIIIDPASYTFSEKSRLVLQQDGKIIVALNRASVLRYNTDGVLDTTFGINGVVDLTSITIYIENIIISSTGKIYLAIDYQPTTKLQFGLVRLNMDGSLDSSFGNNGIATTSFNLNSVTDTEFPEDLVELPNGKIILNGSLDTSYPANLLALIIGIAQFNSDGTLDTSFGANGKITTEIEVGKHNHTYEIVLQSDGKFIISNFVYTSDSYYTIRYNSDGTIDTTYGNNGVVVDTVKGISLFLQSDNKIIKGGSYNNQFAITRYNTDGSVDTTFGTNGIINTPIGVSSRINSIALSQDSKLVAAGRSLNGYNNVFTLARYTDLALGNIDFTASNKSMFIYPNPIEEETNLTYKLTSATTVSIALFDMQGKLLKTYLQNTNQNPDKYNQKIVFPYGLQSGNYLLKISSPDGSNTIKLLKK